MAQLMYSLISRATTCSQPDILIIPHDYSLENLKGHMTGVQHKRDIL